MQKTRLVPAIWAAMMTTACSMDMDLDLGDFGGIGGCCSPGIIATPATAHLLTGDTIQLSTFFFPVTATDSTNWTVTDSSFSVVRITPAPSDMVVLVAAKRGSALVMASRGAAMASLELT